MMRLLRPAAIVLALGGALIVLGPETARADFHCMRIHAVLGGFNGNNNIQFLELRMSAFGQPNVGGHKIRFYDGSGTLKGTFTFPNGVGTSSNGDSILIGSSAFNTFAFGGQADFTFGPNTVASNGGDANLPIQSPNGKIVFADEPGDFNCNGNTALPVDAVSYGTVSGAAAPTFGTAASALPNPSTNQGLRLNNLNTKPANNSAEYALQDVATATSTVADGNLKSNMAFPRNNGNVVIVAWDGVGGLAGAPEVDRSAAETGGGAAGTGWLIGLVTAALVGGAFGAGGLGWYALRRRARD